MLCCSAIRRLFPWMFCAYLSLALPGQAESAPFKGSLQVVIHEIAWMGTTASADQQWLELYNPGDDAVSLEGWKIRCRDDAFVKELSGAIAPGDSYLLIQEKHPDLPGVPVQDTFTGTWSTEGQRMLLMDDRNQLVDMVDRWYAGDEQTRATMQRVYPYRAGYVSGSWDTSRVRYDYGYGTPGFRDTTRASKQQLHAVYHAPDAINVYFNRSALTEFASEGNEANHMINMEERILSRLRQATNTIDITIYELNLSGLTDMLIRKAAEGVRVRVVADSKEPNPEDEDRVKRWEDARLALERLARGADGVPGTDDDVILFANSPIFAFEGDADRRQAMGLPAQARDFPRVSPVIAITEISGRLLAEGERRKDQTYYGPGTQMHNKFIIIDDQWVWTSSMNFTITDLYGSEANKRLGILDGNTNNGLEIHSPEVAALYRAEFEQMWGGSGDRPEPEKARFSGRKGMGREPHRVELGARTLDIYFSPGYNVVPAMSRYVEEHAKEKVYFAIFAWSDYALDRALKKKWETKGGDLEGERTDFMVRGVFEFWDEWWSAAINMTGRTASETSENNPNIRWKHRPPVFRPNEVRRMHHKYMIIDGDTRHNPTVITGSANWSNNANSINDENSLFIYCDLIANQYVQEFYALYQRAGGDLDSK